MHVLITGAGSQLTAPLTASLKQRGHTVKALSHAELDITDDATALGVLRETPTTDAVVNCAAANAVDRCETDPIWAYEGNMRGPLQLGQAAREVGAQYVTISSDFVHGTLPSGMPLEATPLHEDLPAHPVNVYGHSKLMGEEAVLALQSQAYVLRTSWVVGERFLDHVRKQISQGAVRLPQGGHACPTIAADLCEVIALLLDRDIPHGLYHVTNPPAVERPALLREIVTCLDADPDLVTVGEDTRPAPRPVYSALATGKLATHKIEMPDWRDSLRHFVNGKPSPLQDL